MDNVSNEHDERRLILVHRLPGGRQTARMGTVLDVEGGTARVRFDPDADGKRGDVREIDLRGAVKVQEGLAVLVWDRTNEFQKKLERGEDVRVTEVYGLNATDEVFVVRGPSGNPERHKIAEALRHEMDRLGHDPKIINLPMDERRLAVLARGPAVLEKAGWTPPESDDDPDEQAA